MEATAQVLNKVKPDEVYNLAAQSHVQVSFDSPEFTADVDLRDACSRKSDLACDESLATALGFVVKQNAGTSEHIVCLTIFLSSTLCASSVSMPSVVPESSLTSWAKTKTRKASTKLPEKL